MPEYQLLKEAWESFAKTKEGTPEYKKAWEHVLDALVAPEKHIRIVVCAVVLQDGKVVMQLRAPHKEYGANTWFFPGGKSKWGESVQQCTARELKEELGITVDPAKVVTFTMKEVIRPGAHDIMVYTVVHEFDGEPTNLDTANTTMIEWFDVAGTRWEETIHEPRDVWYEVVSILKVGSGLNGRDNENPL
jgi:8-oxo-dGTP diphosphatase